MLKIRQPKTNRKLVRRINQYGYSPMYKRYGFKNGTIRAFITR